MRGCVIIHMTGDGPKGDVMTSLYDELSARLAADPRLSKRGGARADIALLLFNARDSVRALWVAADAYDRSRDEADEAAVRRALDDLRPIFGERA